MLVSLDCVEPVPQCRTIPNEEGLGLGIWAMAWFGSLGVAGYGWAWTWMGVWAQSGNGVTGGILSSSRFFFRKCLELCSPVCVTSVYFKIT